MPTVPFISQPRVSPNALPGVRRSVNAPIEAFGGGVAAQQINLSGPANVAGNIAQQNALDRQRIRSEAALEADQVAVTHAVSATTIGTNGILHGPNGLFNRKGKDAFTIDQDAYDQYGALVADVRSQLATDRQRAVYDKHVLNQWDAIDSQVQPYIAAQRQKFDKEGTDSAITAQINAAIASPLNPVVVEQSIQNAQAIKASWLGRQGADDDTILNAKADLESGVRFDVIKSMLSSPLIPNRDQMAAAYFDKYHSRLVGKDLLDAERLTKASTEEGDVLRLTNKIVATTQTEGEAYAEASKIDDAVIQKKVKSEIGLEYNRKAGMQREAQNVAFEDGYKTLLANHYNLSSIPVATREAMGAMHYQNLVAEAHQQMAYYASGGAGDPEKMNQLLDESIHDPAKFAGEKINSIKGLNEAQRTYLLNRQSPAEKAELAPLTRELSAAEASLRRAQNAAQTARVNGDTDLEAKWNQEAANAQVRVIAAQNAVAQRAPNPPSVHYSAPVAPSSTVTPSSPAIRPDAPAPYPPATSSTPFGLTRLKTPTDAMAVDIARAKAAGPRGAGYLETLRVHGYDVDAAPYVPPVETKPAEKKPTISKTTVKRGPDGKITDTTTTITKPED